MEKVKNPDQRSGLSPLLAWISGFSPWDLSWRIMGLFWFVMTAKTLQFFIVAELLKPVNDPK
jgi:hypothetical protein